MFIEFDVDRTSLAAFRSEMKLVHLTPKGAWVTAMVANYKHFAPHGAKR